MTQAGLGLRLKQQLTLTPRLQQSVKLLQLSALECVQELNQAIAQNPFLEEQADTADSRAQAEDGASEQSSTSDDLDFPSGSGSGDDPAPAQPVETSASETCEALARMTLLRHFPLELGNAPCEGFAGLARGCFDWLCRRRAVAGTALLLMN